MDHGTLERLERLQRLRESGALDEEEFRSEKSKLLTDNARDRTATQRWRIYGTIAAVALIGAVSLGLWATRNEQAPTSRASLPPKPAEVSPRTVLAPVEVRSGADRLADAFEAATGHRSAFSKREGGDVVSTKPIRIIELSFGPALLTKREIKDGCHACTGAIGVYYLKEEGGRTTVTGRWPNAVEGWGWGAAPAEWHITEKFTAYPSIYASGGFMGQGVVMESSTLTELRPEGPTTSDLIGTGFSDEGAIVDDERTPCIVEGKISNIRRDRSFDVIVRGSVKGVDHYVKRNGKFVATSKLDWGVPCDI
jgi:hypothetical protein